MRKVSIEMRQQLALKWATTTSKTKVAKESSLSPNTIIDVINGSRARVMEDTYDRLQMFINGDKFDNSATSKASSDESTLQEQKERLASLKDKMDKKDNEPIVKLKDEVAAKYPKRKPLVSWHDEKAKATETVMQSNPDEIALLKQKVSLLEGTVNQIVTAYELNKNLTSQLIEQVKTTTSWMNEDTKHSLDNFIKHNDELTKKIDNLDTNFQTLMKRHNSLTRDNKDIKEDLKTIGIKLWPANINKLKSTSKN